MERSAAQKKCPYCPGLAGRGWKIRGVLQGHGASAMPTQKCVIRFALRRLVPGPLVARDRGFAAIAALFRAPCARSVADRARAVVAWVERYACLSRECVEITPLTRSSRPSHTGHGSCAVSPGRAARPVRARDPQRCRSRSMAGPSPPPRGLSALRPRSCWSRRPRSRRPWGPP